MSEVVQRVGKYELISKIADGGMAEVFLARLVTETGFEKRVALKKILPHFVKDPAFVTSFTNEARICGLLQHPNVVQVYDFTLEGSQLSLAMEFIEGLDLERVITHLKLKRRTLEAQHVTQIVLQILDGLQYAHTVKGLNVIHRDLKPSNILIDTTGQVKIVDFGVAKASTNLNKTMNQGTAKGTVSYMSPEQASGRLDLAPSSDVFSVGCMVYEMLTGNRLFDGDNLFAILDQVRTAPLEPYIQRVPEVFRPSLRRALTRELAPGGEASLACRYPSAASMRADVVKIIPDAGSTTILAQLVDRLWREGLTIPGRVNPTGRTPSSLSVPMIERPRTSPTNPQPLQGRAQLASLTVSDQAVAVHGLGGISPDAFNDLPEPAPEETEVTNPRAMSMRGAGGSARPHEKLQPMSPPGLERGQAEDARVQGAPPASPARGQQGPGGWNPPPVVHTQGPGPQRGGVPAPQGAPQAAPPQTAPLAPHWQATMDPYEATSMSRDLPLADASRLGEAPRVPAGVGRTPLSDVPTTAGAVPQLPAGGRAAPPAGAHPHGPAWGGPAPLPLVGAQPALMASSPGSGGAYPGPGFGGAAFQPMPAGVLGAAHGAAALPSSSPGAEVLLDMPIAYHERGELSGMATRPLPTAPPTAAVEARPVPVKRWMLGLLMLGVLSAIVASVAILAGFL